MNTITEIVDHFDLNHCVNRDGFVFTAVTEPANVLDSIVIRNPVNCDCWSPKKSYSSRSLEEHIDIINTYKLEKALIIAEDISFITKCPTLKYLEIIPADSAKDNFDYTPLYQMPELKFLLCKTHYGGSLESKSTTINYAEINGVHKLIINGKGHLNIEKLHSLESIDISDDSHENLEWLSLCNSLKNIGLIKPKLKTLKGIEKLKNLQQLSVDYGRTLSDISKLESISYSLRALRLSNCPKIEDFTCLNELTNLEHLELFGGNNLPNLKFLCSMKKLKTFCFSMNVLDFDLSPCLQIPYVDMAKGKKLYNLKNAQLPKNLPTKPFSLI